MIAYVLARRYVVLIQYYMIYIYEYMHMNSPKSTPDPIFFTDGTPIKHKKEVRYLGVYLNIRADPMKELNRRLSAVFIQHKK